MKKTKLFILIACFVHLICTGQTYFDNTYKTGYNNVLSSNVLTTLDSGCVFVNYIRDSATSRQDFGLISIDKHGNEVVKKSFNMFNFDYGAFLNGMKQFIPATKSSYFLTGGSYIGNTYATIINKINRNTLDTIKTTLCKDLSFNYNGMNSFIKLNDNKYFLLGNKSNSNNYWPVIFQLDSNLTITNTITVINSIQFSFQNAVINPVTKKILLFGKIISGQYPVSFIHIDTLGVISNTYSSVSSLTTGISQVFFSAFDTTYVCIGGKVKVKYGNNNLYSLCITKYDRNLNMLWQKTYGDYALSTALADAVILPDGSIVGSGSYSQLTSLPLLNADQNGVILKVDKDGHFRWMQEYNHYGPGNYTESFYGIDTTCEGGFILCGNVMNLPKAKAWAVKTDGFGCAPLPGCVSSTVSVDSVIIVHIDPPPPPDTSTVGLNKNYLENENILIFPNPVKDKLHFEGSTGLLKDLDLNINNTLGQLVYSKINIDLKEELDISFLKAGIYYLTLRQAQGENGKKVFKVVKE